MLNILCIMLFVFESGDMDFDNYSVVNWKIRLYFEVLYLNKNV